MAELWWPKAKRDPFRDGGSFTGGPPKGLLHTTEGYSYEGARSVYASKAVAPHFTTSHQRGLFECWQHVPIDRASRALRNASGGVQTNRDHVIQIEIIGFAQYVHLLPRSYLDGIAELMRWIETNAGVPPRSTVEWVAYPDSYGAGGQRLSPVAWDDYSGWLGHQHAPENDHGDPGRIDITYLLGATEETEDVFVSLGPENATPQGSVTLPVEGEGTLLLACDHGEAYVRIAARKGTEPWMIADHTKVEWGRTRRFTLPPGADICNLIYQGGPPVGVRLVR